ncbi:MAG: TATA-box-binding protein [Candidatus Bathyarchaeia archaeon]
MKGIEVRIENVVASAELGQGIDLASIAKALPSAEYKPAIFPGLIFHLKRPRTTALIFRSGKVICTGAKSERQVRLAMDAVVEELKKSGIVILGRPKAVIRNVVASCRLGVRLDLEKAARSLGGAIYEPKRFPGLVYRAKASGIALLIFRNGKVICAGGKGESDIQDAISDLMAALRSCGAWPQAEPCDRLAILMGRRPSQS